MRRVTKENLIVQIDRLCTIKDEQGQLSNNGEYTLQAYKMLLAMMDSEQYQVVPDAATAIRACMSEFPESAHDIVEECADIAENAYRAVMLRGKVDGTLTNEGTTPVAQIMPVADLYGISVPGGRRTTYSTDAAEASDFRAMGWSVQEYIKLERYQSAMLNQK